MAQNVQFASPKGSGTTFENVILNRFFGAMLTPEGTPIVPQHRVRTQANWDQNGAKQVRTGQIQPKTGPKVPI